MLLVMQEIGVQNLPHTERWQNSSGSSTINRGNRNRTKVKDRVSNDIGATEPNDWSTINWKLVRKRVRNLRQRIYRASQNGQWNKVRSLMKLMLRSFSNLLLSIRRVTQDNRGKQTAGIDGQTALTSKERVNLIKEMEKYTLWKVKPVKRVYIPKANGKRRPLGIPTLIDRVAQAVVKNALEPSWESQFEANSYGFRPGRSCHDAIEQIFNRFYGKGRDAWVLDADIKGVFDNISHEHILKSTGKIPGRELIKQWLKAGYIEAGFFHKTGTGVPQGGIISPLLANIALHGLGEYLETFKNKDTYSRKGGGTTSKYTKKYGFIRYADDFIITAETKEEIEAVIPLVEQWLKQRGLELNKEKTKIVSVDKGFDFLGFNIRRYNGKCLIKPQKEKVLNFLNEIGKWLRNHKNAEAESIVKYLNPVLRGWGNYYKHAVSSDVLSYCDARLWRMLLNWAYKRHPNKGKKWVVNKYFQFSNGRLHFTLNGKDRRGNPKPITVVRLDNIPIERHIKVKNTASPDDPALTKYWQDRRTRYGKSHWDKGSKLYRVAENQKWSCPVCGEHLFNGEELHTHHITKVKDGGTDEIKNLIHLHKSCHRHIHQNKHSGKKA